MKITASRIKNFLARPDPGMSCLLLYGPDQGLVRERADVLVANIVEDLNDPFRVAEVSGDQMKNDPALLSDEANAMSFTGGRRVVRVRAATDATSGIFKSLFGGGRLDSLVVVEAGELGPRSSLRGAFEKAENAAAIACYVDDSRTLRAVITETLAGHGLTAAPDVLAFLEERLGADRVITRGELDKLALYMGEPGAVRIEDALACIGDGAATSLEAVVYAAASGEKGRLDRALERAFAEGTPPVRVLRAAARHLLRLHQAAGMVSQGKTPDQAMKALRPQVIFKFADRFRDQLRRWPEPRLAEALEVITEAEVGCKTTGLPDHAICSRALMRMAQTARRPRT
ncbi:MAG: DNA polymerase III subunit delta [Rhodospirillales bacterium]